MDHFVDRRRTLLRGRVPPVPAASASDTLDPDLRRFDVGLSPEADLEASGRNNVVADRSGSCYKCRRHRSAACEARAIRQGASLGIVG
jgi:hypothetical protein